jgi:hypothetical protein
MLALFLMPVWVFLLSLYTRAFSPRYAIVFLPGAAMLAAWTLQKVQKFGPVTHWICLAVIIECVAFQVDCQSTDLSRQRAAIEVALGDVNYNLKNDDNIICVITDHRLYLCLQNYFDYEQNRRIYCLYHSSHPEDYRTIRDLSRITGLNLLDASDVPSLVRRGRKMLLVRRDSLSLHP